MRKRRDVTGPGIEGVQTCNKHFGTPKDREACTSESRSRLLSDTGNAREKDRLNERGLKTQSGQIEVIKTVQSIRRSTSRLGRMLEGDGAIMGVCAQHRFDRASTPAKRNVQLPLMLPAKASSRGVQVLGSKHTANEKAVERVRSLWPEQSDKGDAIQSDSTYLPWPIEPIDMPVDALIRLFRRLDEHFQDGRQGKVSSYATAVMFLCGCETKTSKISRSNGRIRRSTKRQSCRIKRLVACIECRTPASQVKPAKPLRQGHAAKLQAMRIVPCLRLAVVSETPESKKTS
jgi:hypothetical protein